MHRVLICTIGATPQIVTETLHALLERPEPWRPHEIHIVTTTHRLALVRAELQGPDGQLARQMGGKPPPVHVHVPRAYGAPASFAPHSSMSGAVAADPLDMLADIGSGESAMRMADAIYGLMARFTARANTQVHLSLAGGRKTMSAHALLAMSLLGRSWDEASHVLVSPPAFEDHPQFWHPRQEGLINLKSELHMRPQPAPTLRPEDAKVVLVPTRTVLARARLEATGSIPTSLNAAITQQNLMARLSEAPQIKLYPEENSICVCGVRRNLSPKSFAQFRLMAEARNRGWLTEPGGRARDASRGFLTMAALACGAANGRRLREIMLDFLRQASGAVLDRRAQRSVQAWEDACRISDEAARAAELARQIASFSRLNKELANLFGPDAAPMLRVRGDGKRRKSPGGGPHAAAAPAGRHWIAMPPEAFGRKCDGCPANP